MAYNFRKADAQDIPAMVDIFFSAFSDTIISRQIFPATSQGSRDFWLNSLADEIKDAHSHFVVVTSPEPSSPSEDVIIAFAKWVAPGASIEDPPPAEAWPQDGDAELAITFFGTLAQTHRKMMGDQHHWYLELLAVRKEWQGKKAASQLLRWGVERADEDDCSCFVESTPEAVPVYERFGFHVKGDFKCESKEGVILEYFMIRNKLGEGSDKSKE